MALKKTVSAGKFEADSAAMYRPTAEQEEHAKLALEREAKAKAQELSPSSNPLVEHPWSAGETIEVQVVDDEDEAKDMEPESMSAPDWS